ncbi:MAG: hypothetical protein JWP58_61 [Hymenobacter sp.]|nr:hypothetical protein [Hymenobacter sp.]
MPIQPTLRNDIYFVLLQVMDRAETVTFDDLCQRLNDFGVTLPSVLLREAIRVQLLQECPREKDATGQLQAQRVVYGRQLPQSCPAPLFYKPLRRRAGHPLYYEAHPKAPKCEAARPATEPVFAAMWKAPDLPRHRKADVEFSYFLLDKTTPHAAITLRQLYDCITRAPSQLQQFTQVAALLAGTRYYPAACRLQDSVTVGGLWEPARGVTTASHLGVLCVTFDADWTRDTVQHLLQQDEFLKDGLLLLYADPEEKHLYLVVELNPENPDYAEALQQYFDYFNQRFGTSGITCDQTAESRSIGQPVFVWHDPKAILNNALSLRAGVR